VSNFSKREFLERLTKTKVQMEKAGVEVLLVADASNMYYLSGYDAESSYVPQLLVVALSEEEPYWIGRLMDAVCATFVVFMGHDKIIGYPEHYIGDPQHHPMMFVADFLRQKNWGKLSLGVELDTSCFSPRAFNLLQRQLPNAQFKDADLLVNRVRMVKSPQELAFMRQAATLADLGMQAGFDAIRPGVPESEAAAAIAAALIRGTPDFCGDMPESFVIAAGTKSSCPHLGWTNQPFEQNAPINIELGSSRNHYHAGLARSLFLGKPPKKLRELEPVILEGMAAALATTRPGSTCEEVEAAWCQVISQHGYEKASRIGYAVGIGFPYTPWLEGTASLQKGDKTVLEPNMTFHMMIGMWQDDWGFNVSEVFRVSANGEPETFSTLPRTLLVKA
jgi:ectoine hydrolase